MEWNGTEWNGTERPHREGWGRNGVEWNGSDRPRGIGMEWIGMGRVGAERLGFIRTGLDWMGLAGVLLMKCSKCGSDLNRTPKESLLAQLRSWLSGIEERHEENIKTGRYDSSRIPKAVTRWKSWIEWIEKAEIPKGERSEQ